MKRTDIILYDLLVEEQGYTKKSFISLNEEEKASLINGILNSMIIELKEKISTLDTKEIDKTKGEIRKLSKINVIINALDSIPSKLVSLGLPDNIISDFDEFIKITTKCIHNLYNEVNVFKKAYKDKKVLLIMKYQTLITSFISSFTTLISFATELTQNRVFINKIDFSPIMGHIENMKKFNNDIDNGNWRMIVKDVDILRESIEEVDPNIIIESSAINLLIGSGLQALSKKFNIGRANVNNILYKLTGVVMLILSSREIIYSIYNSRSKFSDTLKTAIDYAELETSKEGLNQSDVNKKLSGLKKIVNMFLSDQSKAYTFAKRDIDVENKTIVQKEVDILNTSVPTPTTNDDWDFM